MQLALITGRLQGQGHGVIAGPGPVRAMRDAWKALVTDPPAHLADAQLWDAHTGVVKRKRFAEFVPAPVARPPVEDQTPSDLSDLTVSQLRDLASVEEIDIAGLRSKAELMAAISAARPARSAAAPTPADDEADQDDQDDEGEASDISLLP